MPDGVRSAVTALRLPDGRRLAFATFGSPADPMVVYHHGWPSSRMEAGLVAVPGVFLVCADRPGYGGSDRLPGRRLLDWPADAAALADHFGREQFHVVGVSGGGPYALACAHALPHRVHAAALISAVPPAPHPAGPDVDLLRRLGRLPSLGRPVIGAGRVLLRSPVFDMRWLLSHLPPADRDCLTEATLAGLLASCREGLRPGIAGALSDARIFAGPWGFAPSDTRVPVHVWHGAADTIVDVAASRAFAGLPAGRVTILPDQGHYSVALTFAPAIIQALIT